MLPLPGFGAAVVPTDVAHELSLEIGYGGEHTTVDHVPLDLGEPQFDLVQPGRVRRSEVQMSIGVCPFALSKPIRIYLDQSLLDFDEVPPAA
jgi:hypothetical protein